MPEQLKNIFFTPESLGDLAANIQSVYPDFDKERFQKMINDDEWESRELKEKMYHTTRCLHATLPRDYADALSILEQIAPQIAGFEALCLPDYVEQYGQHDWDLSLPALGHFSRYSSSEFAIRPFLAQDPDLVMTFMLQWADDENPNLRRFASEGCRPRLPWAMALPAFKKDPSPILPVLEKLKNDDSEFVRKSVANNLNDISKDHPELVLDICKQWYGNNENTDWIVKHGCRTLLKAGNRRALMLFGFGDPLNIHIDNLRLDQDKIAIGDDVNFSFSLINDVGDEVKVRLEYAVDFQKAGGKRSKKVFKISEKLYPSGLHEISKKHAFKNMSTRKHYPGQHFISVIVNGVEKAKVSILLLE